MSSGSFILSCSKGSVFSYGCICQFPVSICLYPWCWRNQRAIFVSIHGAERPHQPVTAYCCGRTCLSGSLSEVLNQPTCHMCLCPCYWINQPTPVSLSVVLNQPTRHLCLCPWSLNQPTHHLCLCPWCWKNPTTCVSVCGAERSNQARSLHRAPWGTFPLDHLSEIDWPLILSGGSDTCIPDMSTMACMSFSSKFTKNKRCWKTTDHVSLIFSVAAV